MEILARDSIQFGDLVCEATHIIGDCIFVCNGKEWSFSQMMREELSFNDIADTMVDLDTESKEALSQFMLDNYHDYMAYNGI